MASTRRPAEPGAGVGLRPWYPLRSRDFRLLWASQSASMAGDYFSYVAVAWLVLQLTGSGLALGAVLTAAAVPRAVLMLVGGAATDRASPRLTIAGSALVRACLTGLLAALVIGHAISFWMLYPIYAGLGAASAFQFPARSALIPMVVSDEQLEAGNALMTLSQQVGPVAGAALAGLVVAAAGPGPAIAVDSACYLVAAVGAWLLSTRGTGGRGAERVNLGRDIWAGLRYAARQPPVLWMLGLTAILNLCLSGPLQIGLATLARNRFHAGAAAFGVTVAAFSAGAVVGVLISGFVARPGMGVLLPGVAIWLGAGLVALGFAPSLPAAVGIAAAMGVGGGFSNSTTASWLQRRTGAGMRGRVMSLVFLSAFGLAPISLALAGSLVAVDARLMFGTAGGVMLVAGAGLIVRRPFRGVEAGPTASGPPG